MEFKKYKRTQISEMRPVNEGDISDFTSIGSIIVPPSYLDRENPNKVSISDTDLSSGSPRIGDMIARNPKNHKDQWLVAKQYFEDNFDELKS